MRIGSLMEKDNRGLVVKMASRSVPEASSAFEISVFYSVLNKARDLSWKIGDQAMKKKSGDPSNICGGNF
jgi:hypothetical protein